MEEAAKQCEAEHIQLNAEVNILKHQDDGEDDANDGVGHEGLKKFLHNGNFLGG